MLSSFTGGTFLFRSGRCFAMSCVLRKVMIGTLASLAMTLSTAAFAQAQFGTAAEAKAMLEKAVVAVKADKAKALAMFNGGEAASKTVTFSRFASTSPTANSLQQPFRTCLALMFVR
jgi:hypothetical protein